MQKLSGGATLTVVNGVDEKGPAAFLVDVEGRRILLDIGAWDGHLPDPAALAPIDAILLSHCHVDHTGALGLAEALDSPLVYATEATWARLPAYVVPSMRQRRLPLRGTVLIGNIPVQTGRSGHAPGGIWIHLQIGDGLLYMGDWSTESQLFPFDMPPTSELVITDVSYGDPVEGLPKQAAALADKASKGAILPISAHGRGPEMAVRLRALGLEPKLAPLLRAEMHRFLGPERHLLKEDGATEVAALMAAIAPIEIGELSPQDLIVAIYDEAKDGFYQTLLARQAEGFRIIRTGRQPPPATTAEGPPLWLPWNVHPPLQHNVKLLERVKAKRMIPAFSPLSKVRLLARLAEGVMTITDQHIRI